jgi:selenocysteine-specific elongation factor
LPATSLPAFLVIIPADQFPEEKRERYCRKAQKLVAATLETTKFRGCPIVPVAARPGVSVAGAELNSSTAGAAPAAADGVAPVGVQQLIDTLLQRLRLRQEVKVGCDGDAKGALEPFLFYIDHCFVIKGQGTVMTGEHVTQHHRELVSAA